jgi:hypothetical protein
MGKIPVKSEAGAKVASPVHSKQEQEFNASDSGAAQQSHADHQRDERNDDNPKGDPALQGQGLLTRTRACGEYTPSWVT